MTCQHLSPSYQKPQKPNRAETPEALLQGCLLDPFMARPWAPKGLGIFVVCQVCCWPTGQAATPLLPVPPAESCWRSTRFSMAFLEHLLNNMEAQHTFSEKVFFEGGSFVHSCWRVDAPPPNVHCEMLGSPTRCDSDDSDHLRCDRNLGEAANPGQASLAEVSLAQELYRCPLRRQQITTPKEGMKG